MAEIHKITNQGEIIYPATTTDAVIHPTLKSSVTGIVNDYNISTLFPSHSISGTNRYTLPEAVKLLGENLEEQQKGGGVRVIFVNDSGKVEVWEFQGGTFENQLDWLPCSANTISDLPAQDIVELVRRAELAATEARGSADVASQSGELAQFAKTQGDYAKTQGDYAKTQSAEAKTQGDYAKTQGDYAKNMANGFGTDVGDLKRTALTKDLQVLKDSEMLQVQSNIGLERRLLNNAQWVQPDLDMAALYGTGAGVVYFNTELVTNPLFGYITVSAWTSQSSTASYRLITIPLGLANLNYISGPTGLNEALAGESVYTDGSIFVRFQIPLLPNSNGENGSVINYMEYVISSPGNYKYIRIDSIFFLSTGINETLWDPELLSTSSNLRIPNTSPALMSLSTVDDESEGVTPKTALRTEHWIVPSKTESLELTSELLGTIPGPQRGTVREVTVQTETGLERTYRLNGTSDPSNFFNPESWVSVKAELENLKCCLGHEYKNPLGGLKVVVLGDSLSCSPESWATDLATELGWSELALWAEPKVTLAKNPDTRNFPEIIENIGSLPWTPDLVIVCPGLGKDVESSFFGSFKDTATTDTFGLIPSKANKGTVRGGIRYISEVTHQKFPEAKLVFCELLYGPSQKPTDLFLKGGKSIERADIDQAIRDGSKRFQYQVLPMEGCGIHPWATGMIEGDDIPRLTARGRENLRAHIKTELGRIFKKTI